VSQAAELPPNWKNSCDQTTYESSTAKPAKKILGKGFFRVRQAKQHPHLLHQFCYECPKPLPSSLVRNYQPTEYTRVMEYILTFMSGFYQRIKNVDLLPTLKSTIALKCVPRTKD